MSVLAVIPARYASTRLPGKPLLRETGKYLIQHVCEQVGNASTIRHCIVATDDERIAAAVKSFGGLAALTRADHVSGTDRIAEVVRNLRLAAAKSAGSASPVCELEVSARLAGEYCGDSGLERVPPPSLVLNVQGDEPEIDPAALDQLVRRMQRDPSIPMGTLACPFPADADPRDPNSVKVVIDARQRALYFSRSLIPFPRDAGTASTPLLHVGVYAYRPDFLLEIAGAPPGRLEQIEKLEQLRVLERGAHIAVELINSAAPGVDTAADYAAFVTRWGA